MYSQLEKHYVHLHQNPEISYEEFNTSAYINKCLSKYPCTIEHLNPTGLIAKFDFGSKHSVAIRTEIDALPINEQNDVSYRSQNEGVMHACGHDAHMAMVLTLVDNICSQAERYKYNLIFVFQPGEEKDGGAKIVLNSNTFLNEQIIAMYGFHVWPQLKPNIIGYKSGAIMGTNLVFSIELSGTSTHASTPHLGSDCLGALSAIYQMINQLLTRNKAPNEQAVINIGMVHGGSVANASIANMQLTGTMRAQTDEELYKLKKQFLKQLDLIKLQYQIDYHFNQIEVSYPAVINDATLTKQTAEQLLGANIECQQLEDVSLAVEDFGFYTQKYQCCFMFLGIGGEHPLHSSHLKIDLDNLQTGVKAYERILQRYK